jgi:signal transduction histidine kinase
VHNPHDELGTLATTFNGLLDRVSDALDQQRRFMADASHELRTPTAIIRTEAEVTLSRDRNTDDYRTSVVVMRDAARRLTRIVDDLFLLARTDSGHLVPRRDTLHLEEIVQDAVRGVRHLAEQQGATVRLGSIVEAPIEGDADLLGRLILNLLDNAIKYSPNGGTVDVEMRRISGSYVIDVTDVGPGIPESVQGKIFERFFRADSARGREEANAISGAGLGLAIARRIAELHGGSLMLETSRPGMTRFRATLPRGVTNVPMA